MTLFIDNTLGLALDAAPWLLLGLVAAGLIKAWVPEQFLSRWLGGPGVRSVVRAALLGAPLPLCSCGAIPLGLSLYRGGASRGSATAFMVGTPGVGIDSVALTYALLGPVMAVIRPLAAVVSAVVTGLLVGLTNADAKAGNLEAGATTCDSNCSCRGNKSTPMGQPGNLDVASGRGPLPGFAAPVPVQQPITWSGQGLSGRLSAGLRYSFTEVLDDISWWLLLGLLLAGLLLTLVPPGLLAQYAAGPWAMLLMALIGIPMYLCAQAATPVATALIVAGVSPGTALVLLLAGPITSIATLAVLRREFGLPAVALYTLGVAASAIISGLAADAFIAFFSFDIPAQIGAAREVLPTAIKYLSLFCLLGLAIRPLRRLLPGN